MGMPLKATENAALAHTPAASTFQRCRELDAAGAGGGAARAADIEVQVVMRRSVRARNHSENQKIMNPSSCFPG
ncbi:hypothetical protein M4R23_18280 [Acidovorax sp. GBBC 3332]|nr:MULTISPECIES: hypothetical protein [unclassified Acidovorax]MDA8451658.1 hypothetical protein [Acidovorax sp. GBBC 3297]MDA8461104.1 hypothetical protein [Acidovorax sp. GBBC 3333]MDA8466138.1 hypothetical protein [Acidovorax sp. GBBC 3332]